MSNKKPQVTLCNSLKVSQIDQTVIDWYEDLQEDYKNNLPIFFEWMCIGYGILDSDGNISYKEPKDIKAALIKQLGQKTFSVIEEYMDVLFNGDKESSSGYSIFYKDYKSKGAKLAATAKKMLKGKDDKGNVFTYKDAVKKESAYAILGEAKCTLLQEEVQNGKSVEDVWSENNLSQILANPKRKLGAQLLKMNLGLHCKHPNDATYCVTLFEILKRQLRSLYEKYNLHCEERQALEDKVKSYQKDSKMYNLILSFDNELKAKNNGLSKYVLRNCIDIIKKKKNPGNLKTAVDILTIKGEIRPKYDDLVNKNYKEVMKGYGKWKIYNKLQNAKKYPLKPKSNDYKIPLGGTYGGFSFKEEKNNHLKVTHTSGTITCMPSFYFSGLQFTEVKKDFVGYQIKFHNKVRRKGPGKVPEYSDVMGGVTKELGLLKKDGTFFLSIPFSRDMDDEALLLRRYFATADPNKDLLNKLPNKIIAAGIDLGINCPITVTVAQADRSNKHPIKVDNYGSAKIVKEPLFLEDTTNLCIKIKEVRRNCDFVINTIKEYKRFLNGDTMQKETMDNLTSIKVASEKTKNYLNNLQENDPKYIRQYIQLWVAKNGEKFRILKDKCRSNGYENISEMVSLIDAYDHYQSMLSSYERIHLKSGQMLPNKAKNSSKRANFRLFVQRRIAARIARFCKENNVNILFAEDLETKLDSDSDNNSLARLFTGSSLIEHIKSAMQKANIAFCTVDKRGTSITDPITGKFGYRQYDRLYVERNNEIVWIKSDLAASLNVLIRGLNRSVCPYKLFIGSDGLVGSEIENSENKNSENDPKATPKRKIGKRLEKFLKDAFGKTSVRFHMEADGSVGHGFRKTNKPSIQNQYLYFREGKFFTEPQRRALEASIESKIKHLPEGSPPIKENDVTHDKVKTYSNFSSNKVLESP